MSSQGATVNLGPAALAADALGDVEDDAREAILVDVNLLVVGNLSDLAREGAGLSATSFHGRQRSIV